MTSHAQVVSDSQAQLVGAVALMKAAGSPTQVRKKVEGAK